MNNHARDTADTTGRPEPDPHQVRNSCIIAIVGLAGTGKSTAVRIAEEFLAVRAIYFGGVVIQEVKRRGLSVTEENERTVREQLRRDLGMGAIATLASRDIKTQLEVSATCLVDGLYSWAEYEHIRQLGVPVHLVAVHAGRQLRETRLATRRVRPLSSEMVLDRDMREVQHLDKATPIALADRHIVNEGTLPTLEESVVEALKEILAVPYGSLTIDRIKVGQ